MPIPPDPTPPKRTPPNPKTVPMGGGILIAAGLVLGPIIGMMFGETSIGLVAGLVLGVVGAVALTIADRRR